MDQSRKGAALHRAATFALPAALLVSVSAVDARADQPQQQSATGHADLTTPNRLNHVEYSFSAIAHPNGTFDGEFEQHTYLIATGELLVKTHAYVTCITVVGNIARIGGIVDRSEGPMASAPGAEGFITVVDNGEGADEPSTPDLASPPRGGAAGSGVAQAHCRRGFSPPLVPIDRGNIQVRQ